MYNLGVAIFVREFPRFVSPCARLGNPNALKNETRIFQATVFKMSRNKDDRGDEDNADRCVTSHYCPS